MQLCVFQSHPFNYTLSWHLSGPLCLRITGLTLNQHQRVQSASLKVKPFQRELLWNGTAFPVVMLAGTIVKESRADFNNGLPFEPHQNQNCVFNHLRVAKLALQDSAECPHIRKMSAFFSDLHQSGAILLLQKPRSFNDNYLGCVEQCHVETLITNSRYKFQGIGFLAISQAPLWALCAISHRLLISDSYQSHQSLVLKKKKKKKSFAVVRFELATA